MERPYLLRQPSPGVMDRGMFDRRAGVNPTADAALRNLMGRELGPRMVRPMSIERLLAAGGKLSPEDEARVLYHELGSVEAVARQLGKPVRWVQLMCQWDIEHKSA